MDKGRISGTPAAAVTPLRDRGERVDEPAFEPLYGFYRGTDLDGVLVLGTTGEGILLSPGERRRAAELAIAHAGDLRVIMRLRAELAAVLPVEDAALAAGEAPH
jgi:dihydrodipicolinate synthase/N-acetylneuraminate lyase